MKKNRIIVVATEAEATLARKTWQAHGIVVTGVGALNVIKTLKNYPPEENEIINFGYAGSNNLPKGTPCVVSQAGLHHLTMFQSPTYRCQKWQEEIEPFENRKMTEADCYTSSDFVTKTKIREPALFDMELAIILALGFDTMAIKIVSDNLNEKDYDEFVGN